jgi:hypothetical protein
LRDTRPGRDLSSEVLAQALDAILGDGPCAWDAA